MKLRQLMLACAITAAVFAQSAHADVARHWIARVGLHPIAAQPHDAPSLEASNGFAVSFGATYLFSKHWALELFGTLPAELTLSRDEEIGTFDVAPIGLTAQYHVSDARDRLRVYVGLGLAYTRIGDEHASGAAAPLQLEDAHGVTVIAGLDMNLGSRWFASVDARWFDMDSDVSLGGAAIGQVQVDPLSLGLSIGRRLR
jgi:outer membrane protein